MRCPPAFFNACQSKVERNYSGLIMGRRRLFTLPRWRNIAHLLAQLRQVSVKQIDLAPLLGDDLVQVSNRPLVVRETHLEVFKASAISFLHCQLSSARGWARQPQMVAQHTAFVVRAKQVAALQFRHHVVDKVR